MFIFWVRKISFGEVMYLFMVFDKFEMKVEIVFRFFNFWVSIFFIILFLRRKFFDVDLVGLLRIVI